MSGNTITARSQRAGRHWSSCRWRSPSASLRQPRRCCTRCSPNTCRSSSCCSRCSPFRAASCVAGNIHGTPLVNAGLLLVGAILASLIGTTGASMILIRPIIRANDNRPFNAHVVIFFIFLVSNIGGSLTPLGDPPLFVGFLRGVDFFWTTTQPLSRDAVRRRRGAGRLPGDRHHPASPRRRRAEDQGPDAGHESAPAWPGQPAAAGRRDRRDPAVAPRGSRASAFPCSVSASNCRISCATPSSWRSPCFRSSFRARATARRTASTGSRSRKWQSCLPASSSASCRSSPSSGPATTAHWRRWSRWSPRRRARPTTWPISG